MQQSLAYIRKRERLGIVGDLQDEIDVRNPPPSLCRLLFSVSLCVCPSECFSLRREPACHSFCRRHSLVLQTIGNRCPKLFLVHLHIVNQPKLSKKLTFRRERPRLFSQPCLVSPTLLLSSLPEQYVPSSYETLHGSTSTSSATTTTNDNHKAHSTSEYSHLVHKLPFERVRAGKF